MAAVEGLPTGPSAPAAVEIKPAFDGAPGVPSLAGVAAPGVAHGSGRSGPSTLVMIGLGTTGWVQSEEESCDDLARPATSRAITCVRTAFVTQVAREMLGRDRGYRVVVDDANRPVGVVTDCDLTLRVLAEGRRDDVPVGEVMTRPPTCVNVQASALDAAKRMETHLCRRLPLVDDSGAVVGVLSLDDLLGEAVDEAKRLTSVPTDVRRRTRLDLA